MVGVLFFIGRSFSYRSMRVRTVVNSKDLEGNWLHNVRQSCWMAFGLGGQKKTMKKRTNKSKFHVHSYYKSNTKLSSLTDMNRVYMLRLKLAIFKSIPGIYNSKYIEYNAFKQGIHPIIFFNQNMFFFRQNDSLRC